MACRLDDNMVELLPPPSPLRTRKVVERPPLRDGSTSVRGRRVAVRNAGEKGIQWLSSLLRAHSWREAAITYLAFRREGLLVPSELEVSTIKGVCKLGLADLAWRVFQSIDKDTCLSYSVYQMLITLALKANLFSEALTIFSSLKAAGYSVNIVTYCTLISGLLKNRKKGSSCSQDAYDLWKELDASGSVLDSKALRIGCNACVSQGRLDEAVGFLHRMRDEGHRPDVRIYNVLMKGYCKSGDMDSALKLLSSMKVSGTQPDRVTYNTLIHGFASKGLMEKALVILENGKMEGITPDVWAHSALVNGYVKEHKMKDAEELVNKMKGLGLKANVVIYGTLIDGHVNHGDLSKAMRVFNEMIDAKVKPTTPIFNMLLKARLAKLGRNWLCQLQQTTEEMKMYGITPDVDTYNTLLCSSLHQGNFEACNEIFCDMVSSGVSPDALSCTILMKSCWAQGNYSAGLKSLEKIDEYPGAGVDQIVKNAMVVCYAWSGEMQLAEEALVEATEFAKSHGEQIPVEAFGAAIAGYAAAGNVDQAISTFRHFYNLGGNPDVRMFGTILQLCLKKGELGYAQKVLRIMDLCGIDVMKDISKFPDLQPQGGQTTAKQSLSVDIERIKFWLGLPNEHYSSNWP